MNEHITSYNELSANAKRVADEDEDYLANIEDRDEADIEEINARKQFTLDGRFISVNMDDINEVWFMWYYYKDELTKLKAKYLYGKVER